MMHIKVVALLVILGLVLADALEKCPRCSDGKPKSCICPDGTTVTDPKRGSCGDKVKPTSCTCSDGQVLTPPEGGCKIGGGGKPKCPRCSDGKPDSCICPDGTTVTDPKRGSCGDKVKPTSCTCSDGQVLTPPEGGCRIG